MQALQTRSSLRAAAPKRAARRTVVTKVSAQLWFCLGFG